jgi:fructokinase
MISLWGIDLGGTKIEGIVIDAASATVLARTRIATEAERGYEHILDRISLLIDELKSLTGLLPEKIGFSTPGTLDPGTQTMKNCNTVCMNGKAMKLDLEKSLKVKVSMANDANCFALAEAKWGAAKDLSPTCLFGVIMGTGVGGGLVVHGQIINGKHGIAGEWGHNVLDKNGPSCYCGKKGCNETLFSGPRLEKRYFELTGKTKSLKEIYDLHQRAQDPYASSVIVFLLESFAEAISAIINVYDPEVIVLGGGVSNIGLLYTEGVKRIEKYIFNNKKVETIFLKPALGDSAGVFGAAELAK